MKQLLVKSNYMFSVFSSASFASIGLIGGLGIQAVHQNLVSFTPLIISLPAINAMAGDYAMIATAHISDPSANKATIRKLGLALLASLPISIFGITAISLLISHIQGFTVTAQLSLKYLEYIAFAIIFIVAVTISSIIVVNLLIREQRIKSSDILIPVVNTIASVVTLISFAFMTTLLN